MQQNGSWQSVLQTKADTDYTSGMIESSASSRVDPALISNISYH